MNMDEMIIELENLEKNRGFFSKFIDKIFNGSLCGYRPSYIIIRPHLIMQYIFREIKYAWQRVFRGWDDRVTWSVDYWLNKIMPDILLKLKNDKMGVPQRYFSNDFFKEISDEEMKDGEKKFNADLDTIIEGFIAGREINDIGWKEKEEYDIFLERFEKGMKLFIELYFDLWD